MGLEEEELQPLVSAWRGSNPNIVRLWWDIDRAAMKAVKESTTTETHGIRFSYQSGMLFITLPSGRQLAYVKPRIGENRFGSDCITYEGVGSTKKWERIYAIRLGCIPLAPHLHFFEKHLKDFTFEITHHAHYGTAPS